MRYQELDTYWKRIFELEWISLCEGSKAIAALIVSNEGEIISEGRNKIGEATIPNPRVSHAEVEVIRNLDIKKYPHVKTYTLYTALEPCPMCMGTIVTSTSSFLGAGISTSLNIISASWSAFAGLIITCCFIVAILSLLNDQPCPFFVTGSVMLLQRLCYPDPIMALSGFLFLPIMGGV